ncbi:hypothetical protein [Streptomyces sp. NPDC001410]|uniref:DUF7739 domain-containing protein n=1 Tax=Streptomyces sp. NPDC001410 TaxID=3364574 RepID=UPI003689439C
MVTMGWNVSHDTNQHGEFRRSYTSMSNLAQQLAHVLTASDWRSIAYLFNRPSGDPFTVDPAEAGRVAQVLHTAATHQLMPGDWGATANELADAADRAAAAGQPWEWR